MKADDDKQWVKVFFKQWTFRGELIRVTEHEIEVKDFIEGLTVIPKQEAVIFKNYKPTMEERQKWNLK